MRRRRPRRALWEYARARGCSVGLRERARLSVARHRPTPRGAANPLLWVEGGAAGGAAPARTLSLFAVRLSPRVCRCRVGLPKVGGAARARRCE